MDDLVEARVLQQISEFDKLAYARFKSPFPLLAHDRDLVQRLTVSVDIENHRLIFLGHSVVDERYPELDNPVRANNMLTEFILEPRESGKKTYIVVESQLDPKGNIPGWMALGIQKDWPVHTIRALRKQAIKPELVESPKIKKLLNGIH